MADIKDQLIKDSYNYVLQSDLSTGVVYRIGGTIPVNPIFSSGLTVNSGFTYSNGTEQPGYALLTDGTGYAYWAPVSASTPSSGVTSITVGNGLSASSSTGAVTIVFTGSTSASGDYLPLSGGTVTGNTIFQSGLTANTISATTYYNLPVTADTFVTGFTLSSNTITLSQNRNDAYSSFTISLSAYTGSSLSGAYLPLSGGTMTGGLVANSGVTANTISQTSYIDFTTGSTNPSAVGGRVFFDSNAKALSYYDIEGNTVSINMGQQLYTRVWNATGAQIDKGKVIAITGTTNSLPSAILARNIHAITSARPIGLAAENIPNGSEGLVLNNGILSGITLNTFANGDTLYLSDTVPGEYVSTTTSLAFTARTNEIGYVLQTGTTTGKIYVNINNEDSNLSLTDKERNILEGNVISSGVYEYTGMTIGTGATINVAMARGWIVRNTYEFATLPDVTNVYYTGGTNITLTNLATADATFILINSASTLTQQTTFPTPQQRRENILLGKIVHPTRNSITSINQTVDFDVSPMAALRDLWTPLKLINQGIIVSPHSTNLEINTSSGTLWGNGIGWTTNQQNPDSVVLSGTSPTTFQYRTQLGPLTGGTVPTGNTTTINPTHYDLNGVVTTVGGGTNSSTNQRVFLFPTGLVRIQLGQKVYGTLAEAVAGAQTEQFTEYSLNRENGILIGIISVNKNATNLSLAAQAVFNLVSKFGEVLGGTGGLSTTTLQQAYDNSSEPEILINSTLDGLSIRNGTGNADNITQLLQGQNTAGNVTSFIRADGAISGSTYYGNGTNLTGIFNHVKVNGTTQFSAGTDTFINFSGINVSITSGVNNTLIFSAGTGGGNSGVDVYVTGGTYNGSQILFTNNTGGTFSVTGLTASGFSANYYGSFSDNRNQPLSGANTATVWKYNTTEISNGISVSGESRIVVQNKGIYEIGYSPQIEKTQGTNSIVTIWAAVNGNPVVRSSSTFGLVSNSVLQLPFVSLVFDLNAGDYVEFYFSSDSQYVQLTALSGLTSPTRPDSPSVIIVAKQIGLSVTDIFGGNYLPLSGGTVTGITIFQSGLTASTISATTYQNLPFSGTVTGGGTTNYVPKWTGSTGLGNSQIFDDGTNVGIGTTSPSAKLDVNITGGTIGVRISGDSSSDMLRLTQTGSGNAILVEDSSNPDATPFVVASDGKVGIGTTSPQYFLEAITTGGVDAVMLFDGGTAANANLVARADTTQKLPVIVMSDRNNAYGINTSFYIGLDRSPSSQYVGRNDSIYVNNYTDKGHYFVTTNSVGTKSVKMSILGNGNVGIGTTSPSVRLDVSGDTLLRSGVTLSNLSSSANTRFIVSDSNGVLSYRTDVLTGTTITITGGTNIEIVGSYPNFGVSFTGTTGSNFTGGTVTGATNFTNGLTANTFSAATYFNLPVSGLTSGTNIGLTNNNGNYTISFTGGTILKYFVSGSTPSGTINDGDRWFNTNDGVELVRITDGDGSQWIQPNNGGTNSGSTSVSGDYLPLSGGTVTGGTIFQNGLTADTLTTFTTGFTHNDSINVDGYSGEIIRFGAGTTYASALYYYSSSGSWSSTDANSTSTSTGMLGIGISLNNSTPGSPTTDGILIRGFAKLNYGTWTTGDKLYVADDNSGSITNVAPTTSSYVVRIIGYVVDGATDLIYFCPDNTWVQLV